LRLLVYAAYGKAEGADKGGKDHKGTRRKGWWEKLSIKDSAGQGKIKPRMKERGPSRNCEPSLIQVCGRPKHRGGKKKPEGAKGNLGTYLYPEKKGNCSTPKIRHGRGNGKTGLA